jgi:predicted ATP-grasp superfamily ATP-dependent carboligase
VNSSDQPTVLIIAPSGRGLAAAARRAGFCPLVADFFGDLDMQDLAASACLVEMRDDGFDSDLVAHVRQLADGHSPIGFVYGGGFEDRPQLLAELAGAFKILGNPPDVVARVKDPQALAELCRACAIPHPEIRFDPPPDPEHWLLKHAGGGGGLHVAPADTRAAESGDYYQRRFEGRSVSALLFGNGTDAQIVGLSAQWTAPASDKPFRYGGAVQPAELEIASAEHIRLAAHKIAVAAGLVGLNSIDFLVGPTGFHLLEINPRPGATLDIFADRRLFAAHVAACTGDLPNPPLAAPPPRATAIFYTPLDVTPMPHFDWPDWCLDRQRPGTCLHKGDPVCTVAAEAATPTAARALVDERLAEFLTLLTESASKEAAA